MFSFRSDIDERFQSGVQMLEKYCSVSNIVVDACISALLTSAVIRFVAINYESTLCCHVLNCFCCLGAVVVKRDFLIVVPL